MNPTLTIYALVISAALFCAAFYDLKPVHPFQAVGEIYERTD